MISEEEKRVAMERLRETVAQDIFIHQHNVRFMRRMLILTLFSFTTLLFFVIWSISHPAPSTIKALNELNRLHEQVDSERRILNIREDNVIAMSQVVLQQLNEQRRIDSIRRDIRDSFDFIIPKK